MTDLKALAEAAKAARDPDTRAMTMAERIAAQAAFKQAATPDAILAIYAERDEALNSASAQLRHEAIDLMHTATAALSSMTARAEAAEASLASYKEGVERLRGVLETIANLHIPDQPAHFGGDELEWAQRHVGTLRRLATEALTKEPPHAE